MRRKVKAPVIIGFLLPGILLYGYFFFIPMVNSFYYSMTSWNGFAANREFIWFDNFIRLTTDRSFIISFQNTLAFMFFGGIVVFALCILFTYHITKTGFKGKNIFARLFYFPNMISQAALAVLWVFVFNPNFGILNMALEWLGFEAVVWFGSRGLGIASLIFATSFAFVGFYLILLLSGFDRIPDTFLEAARMDGAGDIVCFFKITLPLLRDVLLIAIILWIINMIRYFELIFAMFRGMSTSLNTMGTYMYTVAFGSHIPIFDLGYGSAITVVMFLMVAVSIGIFRWLFDRESVQY